MGTLTESTQYWLAKNPKSSPKKRSASISLAAFRDGKPPQQVIIVKDNVQEFVANTTFHGLGHVIKSPGIRSRCFWVLIVFAVFIMVCFQLQKLVIYFLHNPTTTQVNVVYPSEGMRFPNLAVCTLQKFNNTKLMAKYPNMTKILAEFSMSSFFSAYSTALMDLRYFDRLNKSLDELQAEFDEAIKGKTLMEFMEDTTFQCRKQFLLCWFENGYIFDCCNPNMPVRVKRYLLHSGPCFEFHVNQLNQKLPGPVGGFGFAYWYPNDDMFPSVYKSYDEHALHVYSSITDAMLEKSPTVVPVGSHARISLRATKTRRLLQDQLGRPLCLEKSLKYFKNYSYAGCQVECLVDNLMEHCSCVGISTYGSIPQDSICPPEAAFRCFQKLAYNFSTMLTECRLKHCQEACTYWRYIVSLTAGQVFIPKLEKDMLKYWRLPPGDTKTSLIIADVYFSDIEYTDIVQVPAMTIETFVSSIGGQMGLWTGASIVTWIHLLYFCLSSIFRRNQNSTTAESSLNRSQSDPEDPMDSQAQRQSYRQNLYRQRKQNNNNINRSSRLKPKRTVTKIQLDKEISVKIEQTERHKKNHGVICGHCCGKGMGQEESDDVIEESDDSATNLDAYRYS